MSITLDRVTKQFGQQIVVDDFSLEVETGDLLVLLGASGSGKSTLLRMIAGLLTVDHGMIVLHGRDVTALPPQRRGTGFVFQNYSLFRHMIVAQNIEFGLSIRRVTRKVRCRRVDELLALIELEGLGNRLPAELWGGQQRIALARALAFQPEVLLLDEPFGVLDAKIRGQLRQKLRDIQQHFKITTILVTHDQEEAFALADRIGIIEQGRLLEVAEPRVLYDYPGSRFTATFLGSANLLAGYCLGGKVYIDGVAGPIALDPLPGTEHLSGQPVEIVVRPEQVALSSRPGTLLGQPIGCGIVQAISFSGALEKVAIRLMPTSSAGCRDRDTALIHAVLAAEESRTLGLKSGQIVEVGLKRLHILSNGSGLNS
jgi:sulfate/thiosulfate transport system ATP-binding protein